jgi:glycerophosphoryl diester phosphodiesterase
MNTLIFAHRGANREAAENTMGAFDAALKYPIDGMETDVQLTRDEVAVLWHDRFLDKVGLPQKHIDDFNYTELSALDFGTHHASGRHGSIMRLKEFVEAYRTRCRLLVEIKNGDWEPKARHELKMRMTLDMLAPPRGDVMVSSFNLESLIYAHQYRPQFPLVYNLEDYQTYDYAAEALALYPYLHGLCLHIRTLDGRIVDLLRGRNKRIIVYTCNTDEEINKALDLQVDVLISDLPQKALVFKNRKMAV